MRGQIRRLIDVLVAIGFVGFVSGLGAALFLHGLAWATTARNENGWLLYLLPIVGLMVGLANHYVGGRAVAGNNLVLDEIHQPTRHLPLRMAPLIAVTTILTHLAGGSTGREGVAVQVAAGLSDQLPRAARRHPAARRNLLVIAIAAGFAAVFGTPIAGAVFACEVLTAGRISTRLVAPSLAAAIIADQTARSLNVNHDIMPQFPHGYPGVDMMWRIALVGVACGLAALVFVVMLTGVKRLAAHITWPPLRPMVGGFVIVILVWVVDTRDYLGLSLPLSTLAVTGGAVGSTLFMWKLVFTTVSLGSGLQGGEVTPLFVIGSTLGAALAPTLGLASMTGAMLGFVAVFAAASNTPVACTVLAVELFGGAALPYAAVTCAVATTVCSTRRSIYRSQRMAVSLS